jgi:hypothetical protein
MGAAGLFRRQRQQGDDGSLRAAQFPRPGVSRPKSLLCTARFSITAAGAIPRRAARPRAADRVRRGAAAGSRRRTSGGASSFAAIRQRQNRASSRMMGSGIPNSHNSAPRPKPMASSSDWLVAPRTRVRACGFLRLARPRYRAVPCPGSTEELRTFRHVVCDMRKSLSRKWSPEEDEAVLATTADAVHIQKLARKLRRTPHAVRSRLSKLRGLSASAAPGEDSPKAPRAARQMT